MSKKFLTIAFFSLLMILFFTKLTQSQWEADVRLTNAILHSETSRNSQRCIASSGDIVHVVWFDARNTAARVIYYKLSTDAGLTWSSDIRLTYHLGIHPAIALSNTTVHVVWSDARDSVGNWEIYYKQSTDGGVTWGADVRLTYKNVWSRYPAIAVSGQTVHIVWADNRDSYYQVYYKRSTDGGISWNAETKITDNTVSSGYPSISVSGSTVHIVW